MPSFGFSAFLKILNLNDRPQRTEIRKRLAPSTSAYDFHRSMRQKAQQLLSGRSRFEEIISSLDSIVNPAERKSAIAALENLVIWRLSHPGRIIPLEPATYSSPNNFFSVVYKPDFGIEIDNKIVAFHIWNNLTPHLTDKQVYSALSLFPRLYNEIANPPDDIAVLSARDQRAYRLGEQPDYSAMGDLQVERLEKLLRDGRHELGLPQPSPRDRPDERPRPRP